MESKPSHHSSNLSIPQCDSGENFPPSYFEIVMQNKFVIHGYITNEDLLDDLLDKHTKFTQNFFNVSTDSKYFNNNHDPISCSQILTETNTLRAKVKSQTRKCMFNKAFISKQRKKKTNSEIMTCDAVIKINKFLIFVDMDVTNCSVEEVSQLKKDLRKSKAHNYEGLNTVSYIELVLPLTASHHNHSADQLKAYNERLRSLCRNDSLESGPSIKQPCEDMDLLDQDYITTHIVEEGESTCIQEIVFQDDDECIESSDSDDDVIKKGIAGSSDPCISATSSGNLKFVDGIYSVRDKSSRKIHIDLDQRSIEKFIPYNKAIYIFSCVKGLNTQLQRQFPSQKIIEVIIAGEFQKKSKKELFLQKKEMTKLQQAEIIIVDADLYASFYKLINRVRWVHITSYNVDNIMKNIETIPNNLYLTKTCGRKYGKLLSEYVIGWIINHERGWFNACQYQKRKSWLASQEYKSVRSIKDMTIGILGVGIHGQEIGIALKRFKCIVHGFGRNKNINLPSEIFNYYWSSEELPSLLEHCDYIINTLPSTTCTKNLLGNSILKYAKSPVLINMGNIDVISESDMIIALHNNWLSHIVLDCRTNNIKKTSDLWVHSKMEINIHNAKSGKFVAKIEVDKESTVLEVKNAVYALKKSLHPGRQEVRLQQKSKGLKDEDNLGKMGLLPGSKIYVKDLGPQIGWKTVFVCEYAGPLVLYLWIYQRPWLFYGENAANSPYSLATHIAAGCWGFHYLKRILETLFIHRFSHGTMPIFNLLKNSTYYWGFGMYVAYHVNHPLFTAPCLTQTYAALAAFVIGELGNFSIHYALRNLRPAGSKVRKIPFPDSNPLTQMFHLVSCPNYTYEALIWVSFTIMTQCLPAGIFTLCGLYQMTIWALGKHRNYRKEFEKYPKGRKAIIPFIL